MNSIIYLSVAWVVGVLAGTQIYSAGNEAPNLILILGFMVVAALSSVLYFGKLSPMFVFVLGIIQNPYFWNYPLATLLLGACTIFSALYGKTLGDLALNDFYEGGQTHLPGYALAAFLNFLLILVFSILVWFLFSVLPNTTQLVKWFPIAGWGV
ncbi:MAG: hypothetical protein FJY86_04650 [Candidatus Diapherotrites archaeon]|uniref:Uncharacterized protein n=1 Tax=Candidatus Iainarchaeum sp. TaxID=3101447 RepID=A0A8T4C7T0_9ARCH|nr:hypothetical protein [Candidatus Diapherotrites archaeon]